jgi:hypothetical protein
MRIRRLITGLFLLLPVLVSCKDSTSTPVPSRIVVTPGTLTMDALGLTQQFSAQVLDKKGKAVESSTITWTSSNSEVAEVSSSGLATGLKKGTATIQAAADGLTGTATLIVDPLPAQLVKSAGDAQTGALSQPLPLELEVEVRDSQGNVVEGASVSFLVVVGGGSIFPTLATTNAQGRATAVWTLGCSNDDPQRARASSGGFSVEFTASADLSLPAICQETVPDGRVTLPYSAQVVVVGGDQATMSWSVESGSLPPGLGFSSTGFLTGVPSTMGTYTFRARAQDALGNSAARTYGVRICGAPLVLLPGGTLSVEPSGPSGCGFFLPSGSSGDRYRFGVLWDTSNPADTIQIPTVTVSGVRQLAPGLAPEPARVQWPDAADRQQLWLEGLPGHLREAMEVEAATEAFHIRLREAEQRMLREMGPDARPLPDAGPAMRAPGLQSAAPAKLSLYANPSSQCSPQAAKVTALKVAENEHMVIYQDSTQAQTDSLKVTQSLAQKMLDYYRDYGKVVIDNYFGGVADINDDGRVVVFATPVVEEGVAAYVWSGDFFPQSGVSACANSNEMELIRFSAAVIRDILDGNYQALATLVHETKHVSSLYKSIARYAIDQTDYYQPTWVEEGTAEIAGEMSSRVAWEATGGPSLTAMIRRSDKVITEESYGVLLRWVRTIFYLNSQPNGVVGSPVGATEGHSVYGSGWHFHRWLGDAFGNASAFRMGDASLFRSLNDSLTVAGTQGIENATGLGWDELLEEYASAIMLSGTGAPAPDWGFTSYDFPDVTTALLQAPHQPAGFYPWPVNVSGDNATQTFASFVNVGTIGPSGIRVYDLTSDGTGLGLDVKVESTMTPVQIVVVRIQ